MPKASTATVEASEQPPIPTPEHRTVPLSAIRESPLNHRRTWGDLDELAASIARQGVLQPVLLRTVIDDQYELVFGQARRARPHRQGARQVPVLRSFDLGQGPRTVPRRLRKGQMQAGRSEGCAFAAGAGGDNLGAAT